MLNKKFLMLISLMILTSGGVFAAGCEFDTYNSSCPRFSTVFNTFNLDFDPIDKYDSFEARIYNKHNVANEILSEVDSSAKTIQNINPFTESGVYVVEIRTYNKGKVMSINKYEYIFDNIEPAPPVVPLYLQSSTLSFTLNGQTQEKSLQVVAEVQGKSTITSNSNLNNFTLNLDLNSGINYVKFYTVSQNGLKSFPIERIVVGNGVIENNYNKATGIAISDLTVNAKTYSNAGQYYTTKRNFYITGTATGIKGAEIYINGQRALFDGTKYGAFVLLNNGQNTIVVQSGLQSVNTTVNYIDKEFKFLEFNYDKVFSGDFTINGAANLNLPFDVYLNGKYLGTHSTYSPVNDTFTFSYFISESKLNEGKNYIYLQGYNNEYLSEIIYKDTESPVINSLSFQNIANYKELAFKVTDDIAVDDESVDLVLGPYHYTSGSSMMTADIYSFDISEVLEGTYAYTFKAKDLMGNEKTLSGSVKINNENTVIDSITDENDNNVYHVGNTVYVKNGLSTISVKPSRFIAFEKIYLDGVEQIDYDMLSDGRVLLQLNFEKKSGILKFAFINNNHEQFYEEYIYYSDSENPIMTLDYVSNPYTTEDGNILITGKITDSHFNWSSLKLNGQDSFNRYGDYFEARVKPNSDFTSLLITGNDYSSNSIKSSAGSNEYPSLLKLDTTSTSVQYNVVSSFISANFLNGASLYSDSRMKNYVYDFAGFDIKKTYFYNVFEISLPQRNGLEYLKMRGVESSGQLFENTYTENIDSMHPEIYLYFDVNTSRYMVVVDGTFSEVAEITITSSNITLGTSSCDKEVSIYSSCRTIDDTTSVTTISVYAKDAAGNTYVKTFNLSDAITILPVPVGNQEGIFFSGINNLTNSSHTIIEGNFVLDGIPSTINVTNGLGESVGVCQLGQNSFVCDVELTGDVNTINVTIGNTDGHTISDTIIIVLDNTSPEIIILSVTGPAIYDTGFGIYYINDPSLNLELNLSEKALVKIMIDGEEYLGSVQNSGNFNIAVDLKDLILGKESEELELQVSAADEAGNSGFSDILTLIYNRVAKVFVDVSVE